MSCPIDARPCAVTIAASPKPPLFYAATGHADVRQHDVEYRQAVGRDDEQPLGVDAINVAHLAARDELQAHEI